MSAETKHAATGPMAGYLFQPERALHHLTVSPRGSLVGIETLDDVAVLFPEGQRLLEQDKHYTSDKRPLADRSKELWNSLKVWLDALKNEGLDIKNTRFHLVTNGMLRGGLAFDLMNRETRNETPKAFAKRLRKAGQNPPEKLKSLFEDVLSYSDDILAELIAQIRVFDSTIAVHGEALRQTLHDHLHLPPAHADEIIQGLLGWIDELTLKLIRLNSPVWISREAFSEQYRRLLHRYQDITFIRETEEALIPVTDEERAKHRNKLFVKQLQWIGLPLDDEDDRILAAIDSHIRSAAEITRLSKQGVVSVAEFRAFDNRLITRWKRLKDIHVPRPAPSAENEQKTIGRELLSQTLNHREPLAGQLTSEYYLTEGAYHHLADHPPRIGWHPQYSQKAKEHEQEIKTPDATSN